MADEQSLSLHLSPLPPNVFAPVAAMNMSAGIACRVGADDKATPAEANSATNRNLVGFNRQGVSVGDRAFVQYGGILELTAAQWDIVAGTSGGLVPNTQYYLSSTVAGHITGTAPSAGSTDVVRAGIAISPTALLINPGFVSHNS